MAPDDLRALADAIVYRDSLAIARAADYLRACADAKPVGYVTANGLRSLRQDDATVLLYAHDYLIRPDHVALYTHPAPAASQVVASFYTESAELIGTTYAPIKRIRVEDDGTLHVFIDHWPQADARPAPAASQAEPTEAQIVAVADVLLAWEAEISNRVSARVLAEDVIRAALAARETK